MLSFPARAKPLGLFYLFPYDLSQRNDQAIDGLLQQMLYVGRPKHEP